MSEQFKAHSIEKTYIAVVRGYAPEFGVINHDLKEKLDKISDKDANKNKEPQEAITEFKRLATVELDFAVGRYNKTRYSLVELKPHTGRKHQLRRHMKHISHHILGDTKYGRGEHNKFIRQRYGVHRLLLHSTSLVVKHPYIDENIVLRASLDDTFKSIFNEFRWDMQV
jgi:tRNA pseudouridine65 synthase